MRLSTFAKNEGGAALVEFAFVCLLLFLLIFGIVDLGRALFTLNNLTSAVREGARYGSTQGPGPPNHLQDSVRVRVQNYLVNFGGDAVANDDIVVDPATLPLDGNENCVTVTINEYPFEPITPFAGLVGIDEILMSPSASFRWEQTINTGNTACP